MYRVSRAITALFACTTACLCFLGTGKLANAGTLHKNWNYAIDSFDDGVTGGQVGGGAFEFYGLAIKESSERIFIALNSNLSLSGFPYSFATNGSISYGDLFFNFSGQDFKTASNKGNLLAIRLAKSNDSNLPTLGVYKNVIAKNVTLTNSGFSNLTAYNNLVLSAGGMPSLGDLDANDPYFDRVGMGTVLNSSASGTKVGDINFLSAAELSGLELDFGFFGATGSETIGFSLDKSLFPNGSFIANIFAECANDGVAIRGELQSVPEPSTLAGLLVFGLSLGGYKLRQRRIIDLIK